LKAVLKAQERILAFAKTCVLGPTVEFFGIKPQPQVTADLTSPVLLVGT
jgi:hypothetical protein